MFLATAKPCHAQELAPELETLGLRTRAQIELKRLYSRMNQADQRRLVGIYIAFDPNPNDPSAMAACDDDGDYVVAITEAMLRLMANVARAQSFDETNGSRRIDSYAQFVARAQLPGQRLLPPPPGFFSAAKPAVTFEDRLREALAFVLAREMAHMKAGDLVCPHPTATHESGDDVWTDDEQRAALEGAKKIYPGNATERDAQATAALVNADLTEEGALGLLRFFVQFEIERVNFSSRFAPRYLAQHPNPVARMATVRAAAQTARAVKDGSAPSPGSTSL